MANNIIRFRDYTDIEVKPSEEVSDFLNSGSVGNATSLTVSVAATHSGRMTRNKAIYLPDRMRGSAHTWTAQYPKPILVHHDDIKDPIGRAANAEYIDTSNMVRDKLSGLDLTKIKDSANSDLSIFDKFVAGKLSQSQAGDYINFLLQDNVLGNRDNPGLGYINLTMSITDKEAIEKILDGRYLTGSVNATTDSAVCSICKQDWAGSDGACEHTPGKEYEDKTCVLIAGDFIYDEYSFVNKPADELSRIIKIGDSVIEVDEQRDAKTQKSFILLDSVTQEELPMSLKDKLISFLKEYDNKEKLADSLIDFAKNEEITWTDKDEELEAQVTDVLTRFNDANNPVKQFYGDAYNGIIGDSATDGEVYAVRMHAYAVTFASNADEVRDATLTANERNSLSPSSFAGPFPCHDKLHALVARKSVLSYTADDKAKLSKIIDRKCARLGVDEKKDKFDVEYFDKYEDVELAQMYDGIVSSLKERKLEVNEDDVQLNDKVTDLTSKLSDTQDQIKSLQSDVENLENSLADSAEKLRGLQLERIKDYKTLNGENFDPTKIEDEYKGKTTEEFETIIKDYSTEVDVTKISEKIRSGLARDPKNTNLQDPTGKKDNTEILEDKKLIQQLILNKYMELRFKPNGQQLADNFLRSYEKRGLVLTETKKKIEDENKKQ